MKGISCFLVKKKQTNKQMNKKERIASLTLVQKNHEGKQF